MVNLRTQQKIQTHEKLRHAMLACFAESGFKETQISEITRRAGVAAGTFYAHFPSKQDFLEQELVRFNESLAAKLDPGVFSLDLSSRDSRLKLLGEIAEIFLDHWQDNRAFVRAYSEVVAGDVTVGMLRDGINPPMTQFVVSAVKAVNAQQGSPASDNQLNLVTQGILAFWMRLGLQYLFSDYVTRSETIFVLQTATLGIIEGIAIHPRPDQALSDVY